MLIAERPILTEEKVSEFRSRFMSVFFDRAVHRRGLSPSLVAARLSEWTLRYIHWHAG